MRLGLGMGVIEAAMLAGGVVFEPVFWLCG
jgi:hypothetical protein